MKALWANQSWVGKIMWICIPIMVIVVAINFYNGRLSLDDFSEYFK